MNKIDELKICTIAYETFEILCLTETHLNKTVLDSEIEVTGFKFFRRDRDFNIHNEGDISVSEYSGTDISCGGGSIIYYKEYLNVKLIEPFSKIAPDSLAVEVDTNMGKLCVACIYRSPNLSKQMNQVLLSCLKNICNESNVFEALVIGDFNLPDISWTTCSTKTKSSTNNFAILQQLDYINLFNEVGMSWYLLDEITRRRLVNGVLQENLLDQVLYTNEALVTNVELLSGLGQSDHVSLDIQLGVSLSKPTNISRNVIIKQAWSKISFDNLLRYSLSNVDWSYSSECHDSEQLWDELHGKLVKIASIVPTSKFDCNNRPLNLPWGNSSLKRMRKNKDSAWHNFQKQPTTENMNYALSKEKLYSDEEYKLKLQYENKLTHNLKTNSKSFYSYLRNKRQLITGVSTLVKEDGKEAETAREKAEFLAQAFSSVFVNEPKTTPDVEIPVLSNDEMLTDVVISHADLKKELEGLYCFKSIGSDNIHPKLLRSLADDNCFISALAKLFCVIIDAGKLPNIWKLANLTALFRKGSKTDPLNYRPVSLTSIICKIFERIVRSSIVTFVEMKISYQQHGFVKSKSCLTNLLETMDSIFEILDQGSPVDILYFDFKKAFDRVPHNRLLLKLKCLGIEGKLLNTIKDFLTNRTFRVCVEGQFSRSSCIGLLDISFIFDQIWSILISL